MHLQFLLVSPKREDKTKVTFIYICCSKNSALCAFKVTYFHWVCS